MSKPTSPAPAVAPADVKSPQSQGKQRRSSVLSTEAQSRQSHPLHSHPILEKNLTNRPSVETVKAAGITKDGGRFAAEKAALTRALTAHAVQRDLSDRPDVEELQQAGIIEQAQVARSLAGIAKALNRKLVTNSLNQKLYARPSGTDLEENENLFKATDVAPRLRSAKVALEHALTRDRVGQALEARPDASDLLAQNILSSPVAAKIAGVQKELQKRYTTDLIGHLLEQRSDIESLEKEGVLKDVKIAPALQGVQRTLAHNLAKSNLHHALQSRPSIQELAEAQIWRPNPEINYWIEEDEGSDSEEQANYAAYQQQLAQQQAQQQAFQQQQYLLSPSSAANRAANISYQRNPTQSPQTTASIAGIAAAEAAYKYYQEQAAAEAEAQQQQQQQQYYENQGQQQPQAWAYAEESPSPSYGNIQLAASSRRSKNFHLTRILLKFVATMSETGEITGAEKSLLKELIVDQVPEIYACAEQFDQDNDLYQFKSALVQFGQRR